MIGKIAAGKIAVENTTGKIAAENVAIIKVIKLYIYV